jgi:hypothetical protein
VNLPRIEAEEKMVKEATEPRRSFDGAGMDKMAGRNAGFGT